MTNTAHSSLPIARPFLKWAGGKSQLLDQFAPLYPRAFANYHEPFVGSAAVYFHLCGLKVSGHLSGSMRRVRLTDSNSELINCYRVVRDEVDALIKLLARHKHKHSHDYYYRVRSLSPASSTTQDPSPVESAARFIYLNKTCYNGLYRVNRQGQFNVPMGSYKNPRIFDADDLRLAAQALEDVKLAVADFREVVHHARRGDLVYFDPPYHPLTKTASFTSYTENPFGEEQQRELAQVFRALDRKGCQVMLSNSWTPFILDLYRGFHCIEVQAARAINSQASGRGKIREVVVLNYDPRRPPPPLAFGIP
jgi:DNA adenine methylase